MIIQIKNYKNIQNPEKVNIKQTIFGSDLYEMRPTTGHEDNI